MIDSGTPSTYRVLARRIKDLDERARHFELFIVTHIDSDHIGAAPHLLDKRPFDLSFRDVWFNGWGHLPKGPRDELGERQAELLSEALERREIPWNAAFGGGAVVVPAQGPLPEHTLEGGLKLTLLSPYADQLAALVPRWSQYLEEAKRRRTVEAEKLAADRLGRPMIQVDALAMRKFKEDDKEPNGSSIAVLAEYEGRRVLLGADAFPSVIERSLNLLLADGERLKLDAFQVSHHGSARNTSPALAGRIDAACWLISTSGARHGHPDAESIARLLVGRPRGRHSHILFNYRSKSTSPWEDRLLQEDHDYTPRYAQAGEGIKWIAA
jgi:hypothetical protein